MGNPKFSVTISAIDKASAVVRLFRLNVRRDMRAAVAPLTGFSEPYLNLARSLNTFSRATGLSGVIRQAGAATRGIMRVGKAATHLAGPAGVAGISLGLLGGGLVALAGAASDYGEELDKSVVKTGLSIAEIAKLHHVAEATHIETAVLDKGLVKLNRTLAEVAAGKNKDAAALFHRLHIDARDANTHITRTAGEVLPQLADAFQRNTNAAMRARMANAAFGKAGVELLPILALGGDEIAKLAAEYEKYFGEMTPQMIAAMREGDDTFDHLSLATKGLRLSIGSALIPALTELMVPLTQWIANNREIISSNIGKWATNVADYISNIDWKQVSSDALDFADAFSTTIYAIRDVALFIKDTVKGIIDNFAMISGVITGAGAGFIVGGPLGALAGGALGGSLGALADWSANDGSEPAGLRSRARRQLVWPGSETGSSIFDGDSEVEHGNRRRRGRGFALPSAPSLTNADMSRALSSPVVKFIRTPVSEQDFSREIDALGRRGGVSSGSSSKSRNADGTVKVDVTFNNLPQGARVKTKGSPGQVLQTTLNTGPRFANP